jgi:hypothetical protein
MIRIGARIVKLAFEPHSEKSLKATAMRNWLQSIIPPCIRPQDTTGTADTLGASVTGGPLGHGPGAAFNGASQTGGANFMGNGPQSGHFNIA